MKKQDQDAEKDWCNCGGLSAGAIAGIVIGSVVGVALIVGIILALCWWKNNKGKE